MDNLFSEDPQFRRIQYKKLSDNTREWQQEISAMVSEKLPKDLGVDVTVVFQDLDDEKGYAIGTALAKDTGTGRQVGIPIIVKSWHLAPLDLFFSEGKLYPVTDDNLAKVFYQNSLGAGLAPKAPPPNMSEDTFADARNPPLGGKYSYSAPFSALKLITGTIGLEDLREFKKTALANPNLMASFQRRKTFDVLCKYGAETPAPDSQDAINKERALATFTIKKDGPDAYRLYSAADEVYDPCLVTTSREGLKSFLEMRRSELWDFTTDPLNTLDQYGHFTITQPESPYGRDFDGVQGEGSQGPHKNPCVFDPREEDRTCKPITVFGRYGVRDRDGVLAKGFVIPNVVDFGGSALGIKLFLGKAMAAMQNSIAGIPLPDNADTLLRPDRPETGKMGTLVYKDGEKVFATCPFQVTGVTVYKDARSISVVDYKGNKANLIISPNIEGIVKITETSKRADLGPLLGTKDNYFVSARMFFVRMPRLCPVSETPDDFKRIALTHLDHNPIKVAMANGRYIFRGNRLQKYAAADVAGSYGPLKKVAFDFNSLQRHEAEFLLASWGLPLDKCASVLDGVKTRMQLEVHHLRMQDLPGHAKVASSDARRAIVREMKASIPSLLKCAANLEDAQTVDSVLSLGFVNDENVSRFAAAKPMLWEVSHMLAKLLLGARLGMEDIPEESVRSALEHLQRVIDGLGRLKMLEEQKQVKTSSARLGSASSIGGRLMTSTIPVGYAR